MQPSKPATSSCLNTSSLSAPANVRTALANAFSATCSVPHIKAKSPPSIFDTAASQVFPPTPASAKSRAKPIWLLPLSHQTITTRCSKPAVKKDLRHIILIQDWENLPPESCKNARSIIQKYHGDKLNITVCNSAGIQLPSLNLNIGTQTDYPAGHIALLTGHSTVSRNINHLLNTLHQAYHATSASTMT